MIEFLRRNKVLFQFLLGVAVLFGLDEGATLKLLAAQFDRSLSLSQSIFSLNWWFTPIWAIPFGRVLFAILLLGIVTNALFTVRYRDKPLSVLFTDVELAFLNGGAEVRTTRTQIVTANRPGISAYFFQSSLENPTARFGPIDAWVRHPGGLTITTRTTGGPTKKEVNLCYSQELPYGWIMSLVPRWMLNWGPRNLPPFIDKFLVEQSIQTVSYNEYDHGSPRYQIVSTRYQHLRVRVRLDFSADAGPRPRSAQDVKVVRRLQNAVIDEHAKPTNAPHVYEVDLARGLRRDENITVTWERH